MRWSIADLLLLTLVVAIALSIHQAFWGEGYFSPRILFAVNLGVLTTATLGALRARSRVRQLCLGYAAFGWLYLALMLHGGFGFTPDVFTADNLASNSILGVLLGAICGLVAFRFLPAKAPAADRPKSQPRDSQSSDVDP